jgi:hypothetical protein
MKRNGCLILDGPSLEAWEAICTQAGLTRPDQVPRLVYDLANAYRAEWKHPPVRPYAAADLQPFVAVAAHKLATLAAFTQRMRNKSA